MTSRNGTRRAAISAHTLRRVWALDTKNRSAAVLFEAESPEHMQKIIDSFPLIKIDYADYQILPLAPYPAFVKKSI